MVVGAAVIGSSHVEVGAAVIGSSHAVEGAFAGAPHEAAGTPVAAVGSPASSSVGSGSVGAGLPHPVDEVDGVDAGAPQVAGVGDPHAVVVAPASSAGHVSPRSSPGSSSATGSLLAAPQPDTEKVASLVVGASTAGGSVVAPVSDVAAHPDGAAGPVDPGVASAGPS